MIVKHNTFIPLMEWKDIYDIILCITDKGTGKSTRAIWLICDLLEQHKHCCWVRNYDIEIERSAIEPIITEMRNRGHIVGQKLNISGAKSIGVSCWYDFDKKGIYVYKIEGGCIVEELLLLFAYVSKLMTFSGVNHGAELVIYDEFIGGRMSEGKIKNFTYPDLWFEFKKFLKTITRPKKIKLICLANAHLCENDIINGLGWNPDWDKLVNGEDIIWETQQGSLKVLCYWSPVPWEIPELKKNNEDIDNLGIKSDNLFKYIGNEYKRVVSYSYDEIQKMEGLFTVFLKVGSFSVAKLDNDKLYIHNRLWYNNKITPFAGELLHDIKCYLDIESYGQQLEIVINKFLESKIYYETAFIKEEIKKHLEVVIDELYRVNHKE